MIMKLLFTLLTFIAIQTGYSQSEIQYPFKLKVNINQSNGDSVKTVSIKIVNRSLETYYLSKYPPSNSNYVSDSLCGFSMNYSVNYSDPLLMPKMKIDFWKLKPFQSIKIEKEKLSDYIGKIYIDFDYFSINSLSDSIVSALREHSGKRINLTMEQFFNEIYFTDKSTFFFEEKMN